MAEYNFLVTLAPMSEDEIYRVDKLVKAHGGDRFVYWKYKVRSVGWCSAQSRGWHEDQDLRVSVALALRKDGLGHLFRLEP